MLKNLLLSAVDANRDHVVRHRRHLHLHPEPSFGEVQTGAYVAQQLKELGVTFSSGWCRERGAAGIVAEVRGNDPGTRRMALRADMDALPIQEVERPHASTVPGWMHACGHDAHTACLLGAVAALQATREHWSGTVQCVFQPGEETLPGGASILVEEGALHADAPETGPGRTQGTLVDGIVGQHVYPQLDAGVVGFRSGAYMAATDEVQILIQGKGGHAALPHRTVDPVVVAAHVVTALQTVVSRHCDPTQPSVLTFGRIAGGHVRNVIPDEVRLEGTLRTYDEPTAEHLRAAIDRIATSTAAAFGAISKVQVNIGYPAVINAKGLTDSCRNRAVELLGKERVVDLPLRMTGEDFSFYQRKVDGCFYRLGTGGDGTGCRSGLHTADFDIDERALTTGTALMAWLAATSEA